MKGLWLFLLFDLVELSHGLLLQSESRTALSWPACGLIFVHVLEREMGIANAGNHLAYSETYFWESRVHIHQGKDFLQIQGFQGSGGVAGGCGGGGVSVVAGSLSTWRFVVLKPCLCYVLQF